ncbi:MAG: HEAT repeat domain-containing protein [Bacteroidetes bacterium]|nr:HEAT repeat domain-containing protein [Bacteroidota bacterium]
MEKEKLESLLIDYFDGQLNEADRTIVENELAQNESTSKLYHQLQQVMNLMDHSTNVAPSLSMRENFEKSLQAEISKSENPIESSAKGKQVFFTNWMIRAAAAVALIMVGVAIGRWINTTRETNQAIAELKEQVEANKKAMLIMLENQQSASQRVMGATVAYQLPQADDEIVNVLVKTMNEDPNTNVRLTALEALGKFYQQPHVRKELINALTAQKDPMVQIALIRLMVQMKEKQVVDELQKITRQENIMKAVKDEAHVGILKLS